MPANIRSPAHSVVLVASVESELQSNAHELGHQQGVGVRMIATGLAQLAAEEMFRPPAPNGSAIEPRGRVGAAAPRRSGASVDGGGMLGQEEFNTRNKHQADIVRAAL